MVAKHFPSADGPVTTLSMDDKHVAVGMANARIHIFDIETGRVKQHLLGHGAGVWALALVSKNPIADPAYRSPPNHNLNHDDARSTSSLDGARGHARRSSTSANRAGGPAGGGGGRGGVDRSGDRTQFGIMPGMGLIDHVPRPNTASGYADTRTRREAKKMQSSDPCGSALGWPGLRRDLVVSGGSDRTLRVWDIERG